MIIDSDILRGGVTAVILNDLIRLHEQELSRLQRLKRYYVGEHDILSRSKHSKGAANSRIVCNHAKYITDMIQSYLVGNPVSYAASADVDIEAVKNAYWEQDIAALDSELVKNMSIYGRAYELIYADDSAEPRSVVLSPLQCFVVYDNTALERPLLGIHYYKRTDLNGYIRGIVCEVYSADTCTVYSAPTDNYLALTVQEVTEHYFGAVPIVEYRNNAEVQGDYEQLISLIDAYNALQSDRVDDKEQFVDAFLFLRGIELDSEQAQKLREERILMGYEDSTAQYLHKVMTESDIRVLRDDLKVDIHRFSMVPDLSDESFGNNLSGVAIKYKLMGFEQHVRNKERLLSRGLRARLRMYIRFLALKSRMQDVPLHKIDIVFTRNLPINEVEQAQVVSTLSGIVSNETLLAQLSFVTDAAEEQRLVDAEQAKQYAERIRSVEGITSGAEHADLDSY